MHRQLCTGEKAMLTTAHVENLRTLPFPRRPLARSPERKLDACFEGAPVRELKSNQPLFAEGDSKSNVYRIESGAVLLYKILNDGLRQIVGFAFPGDCVGLEASPVCAYDGQAIGTTRVRSLPAAVLWRRATEDSGLTKELFETLSQQMSETRQHLITIGRLSATGRIATFLRALSERNRRMGGDPSDLTLPVRRSDMADFLCLSVETVSRSLTELKLAQIISLSGWRQIHIADDEALERLASGESEEEYALQRAA
jgi:CRP/FNR family transcriptional regulator